MSGGAVHRALEELIAGWDGAAVVTRYDRPSGAWLFIALHDTTLGAPAGGTRMRRYDAPAEGLLDAMRLAEGMTQKWAALELPFGGGKAVLALSRELDDGEREALLDRYGRLVAALRGGFTTGPDYGTTADDLMAVARHGPYVHGVNAATGEAIDPGPYTARGVLAAMRAAVGSAFGSRDLAGRSVLVQGLGAVGRPLAELVACAGAELAVSDLDAERTAALVTATGARVVAPDEVYGWACDVYAPCATGATLSLDNIPRLACRVVAGSANNQLAEAEDAERLHRRGILYAPDFIANSGGATALGLRGQGVGEDEIEARVEAIADRLAELFTEAERRGESPQATAERRVAEVLARHRT